MDTNPNIDSDLLACYVAGEADAAQRAQVEQWAAASSRNARELEQLRSVWAMAEVPGQRLEVDEDAAWEKVKARTFGPSVIPIGRVRPRLLPWIAAAAAVAALLLVGRTLLAPAQQEFTASADYVKATLNDSSKVVLSPGSGLVATLGDERRVELTGGAYFEVQRDEQHPFVVHAGDVFVTVLGTAFEVTGNEGNDTVMVRVRHGKVGVRVSTLDTLVLTAGQEARWVKREHLLERVASGPVARWADRIIQFSNAPLDQVVEELNVLYGARIQLGSDSIAGCPLTATFSEEGIDEIVRIIAGTFNLEISRSGPNTFTLRGNGC